MAAVADAGEQPGGFGADLAPGHMRVHDGCSGFALAVDGPVEQVDRNARGGREKAGDGLVRRQADDREPATGTAARMTGW